MNTKNYLSNLTPLRGIAALLTVIFHLDLFLGGGDTLIHMNDSLLISRLYLMVDFFFVLSGFIICYVYADSFRNNVSGTSFKNFTIARLARVYPLHIFSLLFIVSVYFLARQLGQPANPLLEGENSLYSFITNVFLLHSMNLHNWFTFTHASWSISTEWWTYMLFPFLVRPIFNLPKAYRWILVLIAFGGYLLITHFLFYKVTIAPQVVEMFRKMPAVTNEANNTINVAYQFGFIRCLCGFILGMFVYLNYEDGAFKKILSLGSVFMISVICFFLCMHLGLADVITVVFIPVIILSAAYGSKALNTVMNTKPLQLLGDWSFSIYLIHQPLMVLVGVLQTASMAPGTASPSGPPPKPDMMTAWVISLIFVVICLVVSYLTYRFIEVPSRNLINRKWGRAKV